MTFHEVQIVKKEKQRWKARNRSKYKPINISNEQLTFYDIEQKEVKQDMNLKDFANTKTMGNVTDLAEIPTDVEVFEQTGTTKEGRPFSFNYIELTGKKYRIPDSVFKMIGRLDDSVKSVKVTSTGTGMDTRYNVQPL
jgi:hypothetical protein